MEVNLSPTCHSCCQHEDNSFHEFNTHIGTVHHRYRYRGSVSIFSFFLLNFYKKHFEEEEKNLHWNYFCGGKTFYIKIKLLNIRPPFFQLPVPGTGTCLCYFLPLSNSWESSTSGDILELRM